MLGTGDPDTTELFIRDLARAHGMSAQVPGGSISRLVTAGIVVAFAAVMTVLLLSAAHVVHL